MRLRIIIVDPDQSTLKLLTIVAELMGHEVVPLSELATCPLYSGEASRCTQHYPCGDLLILSNKMTRMSGLQLVEEQMKGGCKGATKNKLVLSTSANSKEEIQYAEKLGCQILKKPFHLNDIKEWVTDHERMIEPDRKLADLNV